MNQSIESANGCSQEMDVRDSSHDHLNIEDSRSETSSHPTVVLLEQSEKFYKCTETKSMTTTTVTKVEKELIELKVRSDGKNDDSSNGDFEAYESKDGNSSAARRNDRNPSIEITTKRLDSCSYSRFEQSSRSRSRSRTRDKRDDRKYRKRTPDRYRDEEKTKYYHDGNDKLSDDEKFTENEASESTYGRKFDSDAETSSSEPTNKMVRAYHREDERDRFKENSPRHSPEYEDRRSSRYKGRRRSPRYRNRRSPPNRYRRRSPPSRDRRRSPPYRYRRRSPPSRDRRRSPPSRDRSRSPPSRDRRRSPPSRDRSRSPSYNDRRSRSVSRFHHEKGETDARIVGNRRRSPSYDDRRSRSSSRSRQEKSEKDRKTDESRRRSPSYDRHSRSVSRTDENRIEHSTRDSYSDSWRKQDTRVEDGTQLMPENDSKDLLISLLRTRIQSIISKPVVEEQIEDQTSELVNDHNSYDGLASNDEHTSQNVTDMRSKLKTLMQSALKDTDKSTSTVTSNEESSNHSTNVVAGTFHDQATMNYNHHIANFKTEEQTAFTYNPEAQAHEHSRLYCPRSQCNSCNMSDIHSVPGYKQIPKPVPQPMLRASVSSTLPPPHMLFIPQPGQVSIPSPSMPSFQQPNQQSILQPHSLALARPGLLSTPNLEQRSTLNPFSIQPQPTSLLRDPRLSASSNPFKSSPRALACTEYNQNPSINARRSTDCYQSNKAPMTYGEYKRQKGSVPSTSRNVHYNKAKKASNIIGGSKSHFGVHRNNNNSMSFTKVNPMFSDQNFKVPQIPRQKNAPSTIQILDDWDVTPESVQQTNLNENAEGEVNDDVIEDYQEPEIRDNDETNQSPQQENNIATNSSSIDHQLTEVNAEEILKSVKSANNLLVLVDIMGKLSENNTLAKVKELLQSCANGGESVSNQERSGNVAANDEIINAPKATKKKHKNELDRLNEDINCMFIRDAVLSANGRRGAAKQCNKSLAKNFEVTSDDISNEREEPDLDIPNEYVAATPTNMQRSKSTPLETRKPTKKVKKLVKKSAKTIKKPPKAPKASDESIKKRFIRTGLKDCSVKVKRPHFVVEDVKEPTEPLPKKAKKTSVAQTSVVKNNNTDWHSLKKVRGCKLCDKPCGISLISHYVNVHPNNEVFTCRLAPEVAQYFLNPSLIDKCKVITNAGHTRKNANYALKQFCYFCDEYKSMRKKCWIDHMAIHTGYYQYQCDDCGKKFALKPFVHKCKEGHQLQKISQPHFQQDILKAFICDLCNFVRFTKGEIETHLSNEHEEKENITKMFKEVVFLRFMKMKRTVEVEVEGQEQGKVKGESYYMRKKREKAAKKCYERPLEEESEEEYKSEEEQGDDSETLEEEGG